MIHVLDRYRVKPGRLGELQAGLEARYLPGARRRGLTLVGQWVTPPVELPDGNELLVLWSLPDRAAFWAMRFESGRDPEVEAWWREVGELVSSRERQFLAEPRELR